MKKSIILFLVLFAVFFVGCKENSIKISVQETSKTLIVGEEWIIPYEIINLKGEENVIITSDNPSIIEVVDNKVIAKKDGNATITITLESNKKIKKEINITVNPKEIILEVPNTFELQVGEEKNVEVNIINKREDTVIEIISLNIDIVQIKEGFKIFGVSTGTATITYKVKDTNIEKQMTVEVKPKPTLIVIEDNQKTLEIDSVTAINYQILNAPTNYQLNWSSSNEDIAVVDNSGNITAKNLGNVTITLTVKDTQISSSIEFSIIRKPVEFIISDELEIYETEEMTLFYELINSYESDTIIFKSLNPDVATITSNGVIKGIKEGETIIQLIIEDTTFMKEINVKVKKLVVDKVEIKTTSDKVDLLGSANFSATVFPILNSQEVIWSSNNENIATINKEGLLHPLKSGTVIIKATSKIDETRSASIAIEIVADPIKIMENLNVDKPISQYVSTYGYNPDVRYQWVYGSISLFFNSELNLVKNLIPINDNIYKGSVATPTSITEAEAMKLVRPGILHEKTKYIVYHDTGNHTPGANATMHANYLVGSDNANNRARSWHYTVDEKQAIQHIPDNEVSWQGDSYEAYAMGIGIETCVDYGSDLYATWQRTAKLMAKILVNNNLEINAIRQHYDFNGKNCPQTLRRNNLYSHAIDLVEAEYLVLTELSDYNITFKSLNPEFIDDRGRVIRLPETATRVGYIVQATKPGYNQSKILYSVLPGLDGTTTIDVDQTTLNKANAFDNLVISLPKSIIEATPYIIEARTVYTELSYFARKLTVMHPTLLEKEKLMYSNNKISTDVVIDQFFVSNNNYDFSYDYIQLRNNSNHDISLSNWTIEYLLDDKIERITLPKDAYISSSGTYLIYFFNDINKTDSKVPLPDAMYELELNDEKGIIKLVNNNLDVVDFIGYGDVNTYEGSSSLPIVHSSAMMRIHGQDTNENGLDFVYINPSMRNSKNQTISLLVSQNEAIAKMIDLKIISLNRKLTLEDEVFINSVKAEYLLLSISQKELVTKYTLLEQKLLELEGLKDPDMLKINEALSLVPNQILTDFTFPTSNGVTWKYKDGQDTSYFDLQAGKHLKTSFEPKICTLVVSHGEKFKEIDINFGILNLGEKTVFSSKATPPAAGGKTFDGNATMQEQLNSTGFGGVAIAIDDKVYFIGKDSYIPLIKPTTGNTLSMQDLRPRGESTNPFFNIGIVNGVATNYNGTGALYHNTSNSDLSFNLSYTYGRNNASVYGYYKVIFRPNEDGTFTVLKGVTETGTNDTAGSTIITLKPGDYLWCPHTYETNLNGGTWFMQGGQGGTVGVLVEGKKLEIRNFKYQ